MKEWSNPLSQNIKVAGGERGWDAAEGDSNGKIKTTVVASSSSWRRRRRSRGNKRRIVKLHEEEKKEKRSEGQEEEWRKRVDEKVGGKG